MVVSCEGGKLSQELTKLNVGKDAPYRMAAHPSGSHLALGLAQGGLLRVDIEFAEGETAPKLTIATGAWEKIAQKIGMLKSLCFSSEGNLLALGGEDGTVQILKWPTLETHAGWKVSSEKAVRNIAFSTGHSDGIVITVDESGACQLWETDKGIEIARLSTPAEMPRSGVFHCKSVIDDQGIALYAAVRFKGQGYILRWRQNDQGELILEQRSIKPVTAAPICGFDASSDGQLLGAVTPDGDICVISTRTLKSVKYKRGAHMTFATAVAFAPNSKAVLSTASDASAVLVPHLNGGGAETRKGVLLLPLGLVVIAVFILLVSVCIQWNKEGDTDMTVLLKKLLHSIIRL